MMNPFEQWRVLFQHHQGRAVQRPGAKCATRRFSSNAADRHFASVCVVFVSRPDLDQDVAAWPP